MVRLDRMTAILVQLQSRRTLRAQDLAQEFGTSLRTIYRDIRTLTDAGVPIEGEAGAGYRLMKGYRLPPIMFSREEASACLMAGKLIQKMTDHGMGSTYSAALAKIRAVIPGEDLDNLEAIEQHIEVWPDPRYQHLHDAVPRNVLQPLLASMSSRKVLDICYLKPNDDAPTDRVVEPVGVYFQSRGWYLAAWCQLRQDYREFRLDRIQELQLTRISFSKRHPQLKAYLEEKFQRMAQPPIVVVLRVATEDARCIDGQKQYLGFVSQHEHDGYLDMRFQIYSIEGFARWLMQFADHVQVLDPPKLRQHLLLLLAKAHHLAAV